MISMEKIIYTADDEMPNCLDCDSCTSGYGCPACGPEYGWNGYKRTEWLKSDE